MNDGPDYVAYAAKMRRLAASGCDLEVDARFVDAGSGLTLTHRYTDWLAGPFSQESPWSVSVYSNVGSRREADSPDGMFVLGS